MSARWDEQAAAAAVAAWGPEWGEDLALLVCASRRLGQDPALVLHGGGNTSVKSAGRDSLGEPVEQLWVKGSGQDLAEIGPAGFVPLDLSRLAPLAHRERIGDGELTAALSGAALRPRGPAPSVETLLHAFLPAKWVLHTHAEPALVLANQPDGQTLVQSALDGAGLGAGCGVVPYVRSGLALARAAAGATAARPDLWGIVVLRHGVFTWGASAPEAFERMLAVVEAHRQVIGKRTDPGRLPPARADLRDLGEEAALKLAARIGPLLRGALAQPSGDPDRPHSRVVLAFRGDASLRDILRREGADELASRGVLTPDHALWIGARPLITAARPDEESPVLDERFRKAVRDHAQHYQADVVSALGAGEVPLAECAPRVVIVPGVGLFAAGRSAREARAAADIAERTVFARAEAETVGRFTPLPPRDVFEIVFWPPERDKLRQRRGPSLAGRVALVTGAAGAIGAAVADALARAGALVFMADRPEKHDAARLDRAVERVRAAAGADAAAPCPFDVTDPQAVARAFAEIGRVAGGVDLLVVSHGAALVADIEALDPQALASVFEVNTLGSFHVLGALVRQIRAQGTGGDVVFISSKNVPDPGASFGAYSASKAAAHQLARVAALELAPLDVRVNMVSPDAVFGDDETPSMLWRTVGAERARSKGIDPAELPEQYRLRNLLKARVTPQHVAEAVMFFAERRTPTTGAVLPVDGGLPGAFPR